MINREKVIREFENYIYNFVELTTTDEYNHQILEQVLILLKEQEAVLSGVDSDGNPRCGACGSIQTYGCNYCDNCGKPILWEGR